MLMLMHAYSSHLALSRALATSTYVCAQHTAEDASLRLAHYSKTTACLWSHMVPQLWLLQAHAVPLVFAARLQPLNPDPPP